MSTLSISADGYIRLSLPQIQAIEFIHLITGLDEDVPPLPSSSAILTVITGYTEWVSTGCPTLTLGWDWQMEQGREQLQLKRLGEPRSNIMLLDDSGVDLGYEVSEKQLGSVVDSLDWQSDTMRHIQQRYHGKPASAAE